MIRKLFTGGAFAVVAALAVLLLTLGGGATTAEANINGMSAQPTTVDPGGTSNITIDADENDGDVRVLATTGDIIACFYADGTACVLGANPNEAQPTLEVGPCAVIPPATTCVSNDRDITVLDAGGNVDTVFITWQAPDTGPATASITAIQDNTSRSVTITVRGQASTVEFNILETTDAGAGTVAPGATSCAGDEASVIEAVGADALNAVPAGQLCVIARDSAGNRLPNQAVVCTTTAGTIANPGDTTTGGGGAAASSFITHGTTGLPGRTATVTCSAGGVSATDTVTFGGNPASCEITANPATVQTGGSSTVTVRVSDGTTTTGGGMSPDNVLVNLQQVNPGAGQNAAILPAGGNADLEDGTATFFVIAAIPGSIALGATAPADGGSSPISCTGSVLATGITATPTATVPPTATPPVVVICPLGTTSFNSVPPNGGFGLLTYCGGTVNQLVQAVGCTSTARMAIWFIAGGQFLTYVPNTTIAAVNAGFLAQFPGGIIPPNTPFIANCVAPVGSA